MSTSRFGSCSSLESVSPNLVMHPRYPSGGADEHRLLPDALGEIVLDLADVGRPTAACTSVPRTTCRRSPRDHRRRTRGHARRCSATSRGRRSSSAGLPSPRRGCRRSTSWRAGTPIPSTGSAPAARRSTPGTARDARRRRCGGRDAARRVGREVAAGALEPPRLLRRLRPHDVLVDAPLARRPLDDLIGRADEVARDPAVVAGQRRVLLAAGLVERGVGRADLRRRRGRARRRWRRSAAWRRRATSRSDHRTAALSSRSSCSSWTCSSSCWSSTMTSWVVPSWTSSTRSWSSTVVASSRYSPGTWWRRCSSGTACPSPG